MQGLPDIEQARTTDVSLRPTQVGDRMSNPYGKELHIVMSKACRTIALTGLMMTAQTANSAIVEVHLDGSLLPNVTLVDGNDQCTTDASGTLVLENSCLSLR